MYKKELKKFEKIGELRQGNFMVCNKDMVDYWIIIGKKESLCKSFRNEVGRFSKEKGKSLVIEKQSG